MKLYPPAIMNTNPPRLAQRAGFTLLEVMLAVALMAILIGGIFGVQRGALAIARNVTEEQEDAMRMTSFAELVRRSFEQAPGNSKVHLMVPRGGNGSSEIYFKDYPLAFAWSGVSAGSKSVILRMERNKVRQYTAVVLYLDEEASKDYENGSLDERSVDRATGLPRVRRLELMEGIQEMTWRVIDDTTAPSSQAGSTSRNSEDDWVLEWPLDKTKRPTRVKFKLQMVDSYEPLDLIFWIPSMVSPEQFANGGGGQTGTGGGNPGGGGGGNPGGGITLPPGGGGPPKGGTPSGGGGRGGR
jgi:prepilin-type N-terminal cleavage/methylation domain-containing protein